MIEGVVLPKTVFLGVAGPPFLMVFSLLSYKILHSFCSRFSDLVKFLGDTST